jgi:hypothetical protein
MKYGFDQTMTQYFGEGGTVALTLQDAFGENGKFQAKVNHFFGEGGVFERMVADFVGEDGQLSHTIKEIIGEDGKLASILRASIGEDGEFHRKLDDFLGEKGELRRALDREFGPDGGRVYAVLNPDDATKPLGRFKVALEERFDPDMEGSALWKLKADMREAFAEIKEGLGIVKAEEIIRQKGTSKGRDFENMVFDEIEKLCAPLGDKAEHMGDDPGPIGNVGDIVVALNLGLIGESDRNIVIEVKNKSVSQKGKTSIYKELDQAMKNRNAQFGIAVVDNSHADSFAPFRFTAPNYILVALDEQDPDILPLSCALRMASALVSVRTARADVTFDFESVQKFVSVVQSQLETIQAMKTNLTGAENNIKNVKNSLDSLRDNVREALSEIQNLIIKSNPKASDENK